MQAPVDGVRVGGHRIEDQRQIEGLIDANRLLVRLVNCAWQGADWRILKAFSQLKKLRLKAPGRGGACWSQLGDGACHLGHWLSGGCCGGGEVAVFGLFVD